MSIRLNETKRNPSTGKLEKTGRQLRPVYTPREGGGFKTEFKPEDEPIKQGSYSADTSLARAKANEAAIQAVADRKAEEKAVQDLKTAQTVTRQLNESAARTGSQNRYALVEEQGNIYIKKSISEQNAQPRRTGENTVRDRSSISTGQVSPNQAQRTGSQSQTGQVPDMGTASGSSSRNDLSKFETRIERLTAYEERVNQRSQRTRDFFRSIPGLRGDNYAQRLGRELLASPATLFLETPERINIAFQKGFASVEGLSRPETRQATIQESKQAASQTPAAAVESVNPQRPEGLVNLGFTLFGLRGAKPRAPKVEVTRTRARTIEADLPGRTTLDVTEGQFKVKSGKRTFEAETRTGGTTKPDAQGTLLRTEKTQIAIKETTPRRPAREFTGAARADIQIKPTGRGSRAKGTQTQVTNIDNSKAFQESGRTVSRTKNVNEDVSVTRSFTETGKPQRVKPVKDPELLKYPDNLGKTTGVQVAQTKSRKLVELEAPLYPKIAEAAGIEVRAQTTPVRQTLTDTRGVAVSGKKVLDAVNKPLKTQKGVSVRTTESGKTIIDIGPKAKIQPSKPRRLELPPPETPTAITETLVKPTRTNPAARAQLQVKTAVTRIVAAETKTKPIPIAIPRLQNRAQTRTEATQSTRQEPKQEPPISLPRQRGRQETAQIPRQKPRTESLADLGQKLSPARGQRPNQRQNPESALKPVQRQEQRQEPITLPVLEPAQRQRQRPSQQPRIQVPRIQEKPRVPQLQPFGRNNKATEDAFAVLVRRGGKFSRLAAAPLTKGAALKLGAERTRNTAARSFKIQKISGRATGKKGTPSLDDFYKSRKETGVFIQKTRTSIDTPGELREITFKGVAATRQKRR